MTYEFWWDTRFKHDEFVYALGFDGDEQKGPVRLEASRDFVTDVWRLNWNDRPASKANSMR